MLRATWVICVVVFASIALACGGSGTTKKDETKSTDAMPDEKSERMEGFKNPVTIDGCKVLILDASIDFIPTQNGISAEKYLSVGVGVYSVDPKRRYSYSSWVDGGTATDDLGNVYKPILLESAPVGRTVEAKVLSDQPVGDVLIFERPVPGAKYIDIDLPGKRMMPWHIFCFRIPTTSIKGWKPAK